MNKNILVINIPASISIVIWLNTNNTNIVNITIINNSKKLKINLNLIKCNLLLDKFSNSLVISQKEIYLDNNKISKNIFNFLKSWDIFFFLKVKFKGKGFRIKFLKKLKLVKFFFGRSHKTFILFRLVLLKKINKYKFILKGLKKSKLIENAKKIVNIKPINYYTLRGLRKSRQIIFKRKGKKGTYI